MKKLLITGFEPFGGEEINPSWEAVCRLPSRIGEYSLTKLVIPVTYGEAARTVIEEAEAMCADAVICVGQAGGRDAITPELVGINLRHATIPDNNGSCPTDEAVMPSGENAYFSTLPVRKMSEAINGAGILSRVSYSAGTYVCNDVLYSLLYHFLGTDTRACFIHVPYSSEQGKTPSMQLSDIINGLIAAIEVIG